MELGLPVKNITQISSPADKNKKFPLFVVTLSGSQQTSHQSHGSAAAPSPQKRLERNGDRSCATTASAWGTPLLSAIRSQSAHTGGEHTSNQCTRNRKTEPAICANCTGPHPASYRGCPYLEKAKKDGQRKLLPTTKGFPTPNSNRPGTKEDLQTCSGTQDPNLQSNQQP